MFETSPINLAAFSIELTRRGALTEADVDAALREVRRALLEADVALEVVREFVERVRKEAVGIAVIKSVTPGQMVVKIVHDQLVETLGEEGRRRRSQCAVPPVAIMMVGLQGSGKTTTTAKLAKRLTERQKKKVLMASLDVRRPAAMEQLARARPRCRGRYAAGRRRPAAGADRASARSKPRRLGGYDVVLLDTAGRITLDEELMQEAADVRKAANPHEVLLVADALTGQDAVNLARSFNERVGITGIVLTRVDGDGRGGAALSMRPVTGKPIKLLGVGERMDALEDFSPGRVADRILGMGDIVALVEKAAQTIDAEKAARTAEKMRKGQFDLQDLRDQLDQMTPHGRHVGPDGHAARHGQDEEPARAGQSRRAAAQAPGRDHRFDDAEGAPQSGYAQGQPQAPHRGRLRHQAGRHQPPAENASRHGRHDEDDGRRQARSARRPRQRDGLRRRRHAVAGADQAKLAEQGGLPNVPGAGGLPPNMPGLPPKFPGGACRD